MPRTLYPRHLGGGVGKHKTLELFPNDGTINGVDRLDTDLTLNGTTVSPSIRYKGGDAVDTAGAGNGWPAWGYGGDLTIVGVGSPTLNAGSPCLGTNDDSIKGDGTRNYAAQAVSVGEITTEDFVVEAVFKAPENAAEEHFIDKRDLTGAPFAGWWLANLADDKLRMGIDAGGADAAISTSALTPGAWYHYIGFVDRDEASNNGWRVYVNGVTDGQLDPSALAGSIASGQLMRLMSGSTGVNDFTSNLAYVAMWKRDAWMAGGAGGATAMAACAAQRFAMLTGVYPTKAKGTAVPTVKTRASSAYLRKFDSSEIQLYKVGSEWMRCEYIQDSASTDCYGYLAEIEAQNKCLQSQTFGATWALLDVGDSVSADAADAPDGTTTADALIADATDGDHGVTQDITLTAVAWAFSVFAKPGDKDWLYISDDTVANATCYFDIANGTVGTAGAGAVGHIEGPFNNGFYRCSIVFTGTVAAHTFKIQTADADGDKSIVGDGAATNTTLWGGQCEIGSYPTSYVTTVAAAVSRVKDQLRYKGDDGNLGGVGSNMLGTAICDVLIPAYVVATDLFALSLSDGGAAGDRWQLYLTPSGGIGKPRLLTAATAGDGGLITGTSDGADGVKHSLRATWKTDSEHLYLDASEEGSEDTACDIPDDLDNIDISQNRTAVAQLSGLLSNLRIYKKVLATKG